MMQRFESERDTWLLVLAWGAVVVCAVAVIPLLVANVDGTVKLIAAALIVLSIVLIAWVNLGTYYVVGGGQLRIRCGPFRWRVPIDEIHRAVPTRAPWSSPALSLNRLRIEYGDGKWILVSPKRREAFLGALRLTDG